MTRIEFTAVDDRDLVAGITALLTAMADGIDYARPLLKFTRATRGTTTYERQRIPHGYVPCPRRGEHEKLTDCWMCWNDVMHGVIEEEVAALGPIDYSRTVLADDRPRGSIRTTRKLLVATRTEA